jgi:hypothetical protein
MLCGILCSQKSRNYCEKDNAFEKLIVNLPTEQTMTTPELELVALSRPDCIHNFAMGKITSDLNNMMRMNIGTAASYTKRRLFMNHIQRMAPQTQQNTRDSTAKLCTLSTYEGGCMKLLNWFNELKNTRICVQ